MIQRLARRLTSAGLGAMGVSTRLMTGAMVIMLLHVRECVYDRPVNGMVSLFVPNELETHLITKHNVPPEKIYSQREFCKAAGKDYADFLKTSHDFMHTTFEESGHSHGQEG